MKELEVRIPQSLDEITVGQYQQFIEETNGMTDESLLQDKVITIFCGLTLPQLRSLMVGQVNDIISRLEPLINQFGDEQKFVQRFTVNNVEYGFIPNLETNISYGENKDASKYFSEGVASVHKAMAILYRPILNTFNHTYNISEYQVPNPHEDALKEMPVSVMLGANVFFWNLIKELLTHIPSYLKEEMGEEQYSQMMKKASTNIIGEDMMKYSALLKEI
jgi:hypothetical protein